MRYLKVLHVGFDGKTHIGELVVNRLIADAVLDIFKRLYEAGYEIEKIRLIDEYDADDEKSMRIIILQRLISDTFPIQRSCQSMR